MKPQFQQYRHDPASDMWGDCHRACLASILEFPVEIVPNFYRNSEPHGQRTAEECEQEIATWLGVLGYRQISIPFPGDTCSPDDIQRMIDVQNPGGLHYIFGCRSPNGTGHSVVFGPNGLRHDPAGHSEIMGPMKDGYYWVTFIGVKV